MQVSRSHRTASAIVTCLLLLGLLVGVADAREVQLAGIRLGQHAVNLLDIYGQPLGIATGQGDEFASGAAAGGLGGELGGLLPPPPMAAGASGMLPGGGMPEAAPPPPPPGAAPEGAPGVGPGAFPGAEAGAAAGAGAAAAGAGVQRNPFPLWALPVWVSLGNNEVQWLYRVGPVVLGFVLDRDGYISSIALAGENCDFARTALWQPHQYIKLGDNYKRVIYRYGWPDETLTYYGSGPGEVSVGGGPISVTWNGVTREFSRDCILRYTEHNNVALTFHNMECVRIHIWTHE